MGGVPKQARDGAGNKFPRHPLFEIEDGEHPPDVSYVFVTRFEPGIGQVWARRQFRAQELPDLDTLGRIFGGGEYELIAKGADASTGKPTHITKKATYRLSGPSLPLNPGDQFDKKDAPAAAAPAAMPMMGGGAGGGGDPFLMFMMQQAQQQHALALAQMQQQSQLQIESIKAQAAAQQAQTQMIVALVGGQKNDAAAMIEAIAKMQASQTKDDASPLEILKAGMEMGAKAAQADTGEGVAETLSAVGAVVGPFMQMEAEHKKLEAEKIKAGHVPPPTPAKAIPQAPPNGAPKAGAA